MDSECLFGPNDIPPLPPPLLCNPLPLQCLAADALPATLQEEIGDMLDVYVNTAAIEPPPEFNDKKVNVIPNIQHVHNLCMIERPK